MRQIPDLDGGTIDVPDLVTVPAGCTCHRCIREFDIRGPSGHFPLSAERMILCQFCGNKRCPQASDHRLQCTGSNDRGQTGSVYQ